MYVLLFGSLQPISIFTDMLKKNQTNQNPQKAGLPTIQKETTKHIILYFDFKNPSELYMHRSTTTFLHKLIKKPQGNINHMLSACWDISHDFIFLFRIALKYSCQIILQHPEF